MLGTIGLAALIGLSEIDRILGSLPSEDGHVATLGNITGLFALPNVELWAVWPSYASAGMSTIEPISWAMVAYAVMDLFFIAAYGRLLWRFVRPVFNAPMPSRQYTEARWMRRVFRGAIGCDVLESLLLILAAAFLRNGPIPSLLAYVIAGAATLKWVSLFILFAMILRIDRTRAALRVFLRKLGWALKVHRLALIVLVLLGSLALVPSGQAVFDQMPDVQRTWLASKDIADLKDPFWVLVVLTVTSIAFWMLGRRRSKRALHRLAELVPIDPTPDYRWWITVPVLVSGATAVVATASDRTLATNLSLGAVMVAGMVVVFLGHKALNRRTSVDYRTDRGRSGFTTFEWGLSAAVVALCAVSPFTARDQKWWTIWWLACVGIVAFNIATVSQRWLKSGENSGVANARAVTGLGGQATAGPFVLAEEAVSFEATASSGTAATSVKTKLTTGEVWVGWGAFAGLIAAIAGAWFLGPILEQRNVNAWVPAALVSLGAVVITASILIQRFRRDERPGKLQLPDDERMPTGVATTRVGDTIAVLVWCLGPLSMIRSSVGPSIAARFYSGESAESLAAATVWLVSAIVLALLTPVTGIWIIHSVDKRILEKPHGWMGDVFDPTGPGGSGGRVRGLEVAMFLIGTGVIGVAVLWPDGFADALGTIAVTVALLGSWSLILGAVIVSMQRRRPLALFPAIGLASTPNITLVVILMLATSTFANSSQLHAVRVLRADATPTKSPDRTQTWASQAVTSWLNATRNGSLTCNEASASVRPMLIIVAEGGGGRAAYWTARSLEALNAQSMPKLCGAPFVASGISGGSVGLVVDQTDWSKDTVTSSPMEAVIAMTGPKPLGRAVTGLLGGDLLAGLTGLRVPSGSGNEPTWTDRAGLLEEGWADVTGEAGSPLNAPLDSPPPAGKPLLVMNSIDSVSGCRFLVAQSPVGESLAPETATPTPAGSGPNASVPLVESQKTMTPSRCARPDSPEPGTTTLNQLYQSCLVNLRRSTAALLSARFPIVTPGGRLPQPGCRDGDDDPDVQLVDGGYSDPSGLASMNDIAPAIIAEVARHNAETMACQPESKETGARTCDDSLIQPIVVYLKNSPGDGLADKDTRLTTELFVPLQGLGARNVQAAPVTWLQRLHQLTADVCIGPVAERCKGRLKELQSVRTVVIAPRTKPAPPPPLGWTLSELSRKAMDEGLKAEGEVGRCHDLPNSGNEWASLCDLRKAVEASP